MIITRVCIYLDCEELGYGTCFRVKIKWKGDDEEGEPLPPSSSLLLPPTTPMSLVAPPCTPYTPYFPVYRYADNARFVPRI